MKSETNSCHNGTDLSEVQDLSTSSHPSHQSCHYEMSALMQNSPISDMSSVGLIHYGSSAIREPQRVLIKGYYTPEVDSTDHYSMNPVSINDIQESQNCVTSLKHPICESNGSYLNASNGSSHSNRMLEPSGDHPGTAYHYSAQQVSCVVQALQQASDLKKLEEFINCLPQSEQLQRSEDVLRARASLAFHKGDYKELYRILEAQQYSPKYHSELQKYWYDAHYRELARSRGRVLGAVDKYRVRKKFPLPVTIWDGDELIYCFKEKARQMLKECYKTNKYPSPEDKKNLAKQTKLSITQGMNFSCLSPRLVV